MALLDFTRLCHEALQRLIAILQMSGDRLWVAKSFSGPAMDKLKLHPHGSVSQHKIPHRDTTDSMHSQELKVGFAEVQVDTVPETTHNQVWEPCRHNM